MTDLFELEAIERRFLATRRRFEVREQGGTGVNIDRRTIGLVPSPDRNAPLIGSLTRDGIHMPVLNVDVPARLTSTREIVFDTWTSRRKLRSLQQAAQRCGISPVITVAQPSAFLEPRPDRRGYQVRLRLIACASLVPSRTAGHCHVYIDVPVTTRCYMKLLRRLAAVGAVPRDWAAAARKQRCSTVLDPGYELVTPSQCRGAGQRARDDALRFHQHALMFSARCHSCGTRVPVVPGEKVLVAHEAPYAPSFRAL